ncbi:MAG: hypothetical protein FGM46_09250, partial [Ferruginibacter sp.]|nr:hypothetical protein [Ferruginibacter sp.]
MLHLLRIEWLKIKSYKAFIIISVFFAVSIFLTNFIVYKTFNRLVQDSGANQLMNNFNPYDFSHVWQTAGYASGYLLLFPVILLII